MIKLEINKKYKFHLKDDSILVGKVFTVALVKNESSYEAEIFISQEENDTVSTEKYGQASFPVSLIDDVCESI